MEEQHHDEQESLEQPQDERREEDRFTNFMFGHIKDHPQRKEHLQELNSNQNFIDFEQLMIHIDTLMESTRDYKPLLQKFIKQFWKK